MGKSCSRLFDVLRSSAVGLLSSLPRSLGFLQFLHFSHQSCQGGEGDIFRLLKFLSQLKSRLADVGRLTHVLIQESAVKLLLDILKNLAYALVLGPTIKQHRMKPTIQLGLKICGYRVKNLVEHRGRRCEPFPDFPCAPSVATYTYTG